MKEIRNKLIIGGLFGVAVVIGLLLYSDFRAIRVQIHEFPLFLLAPVLGLTLLNYAIRWLKWHLYLRLIGVHGLSLTDSAIIFVSGLVLALSPGKVAEILKAAAVRSMTDTPMARTVPVILAERVTDGLGMLILAAIGVGGILSQDYSQQEVLLPYLPAYFAVLGMLLLGILALQIRPLVLLIIGWLDHISIIRRYSKSLRELYQSSFELFRPVPLLFAIASGAVSWFGECVAFYLILVGLGFPSSWLLLWQATFILAASSIIGAVSGLPGGLGAAEFSIVGMVQLLVLHQVDSALSGAAALILRLSTLWFGSVLGLITAIAFRNRIFALRLTGNDLQESVPSEYPGISK